MRRFIIAAVAALGVLLAQPTQPAVAAPEPGGTRWLVPLVCVDLHASNDGYYWYTSHVVPRMDTLPNITYVYESNCEAAGHVQIIHVYEEKFLYADGTCDYRYMGLTALWDTPDGYTYDGYISRARVRLNDCYRAKLSQDRKMKIVGHELMRAIGPGDWDVCPSLMGPNCTLSSSWPDKPDDDRVRTWYA